jgi:hypothetical protein
MGLTASFYLPSLAQIQDQSQTQKHSRAPSSLVEKRRNPSKTSGIAENGGHLDSSNKRGIEGKNSEIIEKGKANFSF